MLERASKIHKRGDGSSKVWRKRRHHPDPAAGLFHSAGGGKQKPRPKDNPGEPDEETSRQSYSQDKFLQSQILLQVLVGQ